MSQTDRQTDTTQKATWWSITAFSQEEIDKLNGPQFPEWVRKVFGGLESCPDTGRVHFQGAVQAHHQVRFSAVKQWLATSHIEPARNKEALRKYVMKQETAVGVKSEVENSTPYYRAHNLLEMLAKAWSDLSFDDEDYIVDNKLNLKAQYWDLVKHILKNDKTLISAFMNPSLEKAWVNTASFWKHEAEPGALVLQPQADLA